MEKNAGKSLKVLSRFGVRVDSADIPAATELGIVVTNTPGAMDNGVAELTIGVVYALCRNIPLHSSWTKSGEWRVKPGIEVAGKTPGIVGLGRICKRVATLAIANGMRVVGYDVVWDEAFASTNGVEHMSLAELLAQSDIVTLHVPSIPETSGMLGARQIAQMKPGERLINAARGDIVDQDALLDALRSGHLAGAAIDGWPTEPPESNPLLELDCIIASPHMGSGTVESTARISHIATENAIAVLRGQRPKFVVNPEVYDRQHR